MARALAIAGRDEKPALQQVPVADPGPGQVRVAVQAASINGIDAVVGAGYAWDLMPHSFPVVLGRDLAGTVEAAGSGVTGISPGDRVAATITGMTLFTGAIAEQVTLDAAAVVPVPDGVSAAQAAAIGLAGVTARDLVDTLRLGPADTVLISGATGGVGGFAVQLAAATGARVLGTAHTDEASAFVRELGAEAALDHTGDLAEQLKLVAPDGLSAILHAAGDLAALAPLLAPGGRLASALGATAEQTGRDDLVVTGIYAAATAEKVAALLAGVADGSIRVPLAGTYDFEEAARALSDFSGHKLGKLVVTVH